MAINKEFNADWLTIQLGIRDEYKDCIPKLGNTYLNIFSTAYNETQVEEVFNGVELYTCYKPVAIWKIKFKPNPLK